ncbi:hypothetical protein H9K76_05340 [Diaphorobacter ruginosibacter]|uniref:Uncharacterized protein n=1 Tax=Diaphorobacter ruginosibacter TaxID=1715720 RepID=A0A7G9RRP9_9BURK|nr:hypothetical protein [Diaphorobacter ruginosibacter]QNN58274.1 hypothetical protein H9K76_05340 [Diaphorobacter ruginosibacter]
MKRLHVLSLLLWLGIVLCPAHAAPPSYEELQAHPERALPMQAAWQLQPVDAQSQRWEDIFSFTIGTVPDLMTGLRWCRTATGQGCGYRSLGVPERAGPMGDRAAVP